MPDRMSTAPGFSNLGFPEGRLSNKSLARRTVLFASAHSIVDFSNGASVATLDVLQGLTTHGFDCQAFCTPKLDTEDEVCFEKIISQLREPYQLRESVCGNRRAGALHQTPRCPHHGRPVAFDAPCSPEPGRGSDRPAVLREVPRRQPARRAADLWR